MCLATARLSLSALSREQAGLIEKRDHAGDKRLLDMRLTAKGQELMARIVPIADAYQEELMARLGEDAAPFRAALLRLLEER